MAQNLSLNSSSNSNSNSNSNSSSNNSVSTTLQTDSFDLLVQKSTIQDLYQNSPPGSSNSTTNSQQMPSFQLSGDVPQGENAQDKVDVYFTNWKIDPLQCPNETNSTQANRVSVQINQEGTQVPYSLPNDSSIEILYPVNSSNTYTSCMTGCQSKSSNEQNVNTGSQKYYICICNNISMLSPQEQFLSVFSESNLMKLANLAAIIGFRPWRSPSIWILGFIDLTFLVALISMFRKTKSLVSSVSSSSLDQKLQKKNIYLVAFMV